jgi:hypothetical protein
MASSPVDVRGMQASQMVQRLAKMGPQSGGAGGAGGAASPDAAGQQMSQQLSELKGADPQMLVKAAEQMKAMATAIYVRTSFQVPEAARHIAQATKSLDAAIKALQQASATANTVSSPIVNNAGMSPTQPQPGGQPDGGGAEGMPPQ